MPCGSVSKGPLDEPNPQGQKAEGQVPGAGGGGLMFRGDRVIAAGDGKSWGQTVVAAA